MSGTRKKSWRTALLALILLAGLSLSSSRIQPVKAASDYTQPESPAQVVGLINAYRQANGLPALQTNSLLATLAQSQSEYQAQIGSVTHEGPGGTRPIDRAYAAGYGNGASIFLSEIIYGGMTADAPTAMNWWKNSKVHNSVMLSSTYAEIGAGVATNGTATYYTAELGVIAGGTAPSAPTGGSSGSSGSSSGSGSSPPAEPVFIAVPVMQATARPDGAIIHTIKTGQALWTLAAVYEVDLAELMARNDLNEYSYIFVGDEIIIQPPEESASNDPTESSDNGDGGELFNSQATATRQAIGTALAATPTRPARTNTPGPNSPTSTPTPTAEAPPTNPAVRWIVILAFGILFMVVVGSMFFQKPPQPPSNDDVVR